MFGHKNGRRRWGDWPKVDGCRGMIDVSVRLGCKGMDWWLMNRSER